MQNSSKKRIDSKEANAISGDGLLRISHGDYSAVIDIRHGANCVSLRHTGYNAVLLREPKNIEDPDNPYLYGMPILFPVNRIEGGEFEFEGRRYVFPINEPQTGCHLHGELHRTAFEVMELSEESIVVKYSATADAPYLDFPHEFDIVMRYTLTDDGMYHTVEVKNNSKENMPVFLGFHTTFNTLFSENSQPEDIRVFTDISEEYERNVALNYLPTGNKPSFDAVSSALQCGCFKPFEQKISRHYRGTGNMSITDTANKLRVVYENDEKYTFRLIFNGGDEGYICLEPQNCLANCQNSPFSREEAGFDYIRSGETKAYRSRFFVESI